tara:strand:+ start:1252 stop:1824 length:573 start_codon:yes stop_codon:yes gene_type:complete
MRALYSFIVEPVNNRRYDNIKKINDLDFITSVSEEDHMASNRYGVVKELPLGYKGEIEIGDTLLVHHNVFKFYNDMYGRRKSGKSFFKDNLFFVDPDQFFLYKHNNIWKAHGKYCFIKPIKPKDCFLEKGGKYERLQGTIKYINDELVSLGVSVGDTIIFTPESEYEFTVEDELLYRMFTNNITTILQNG